MTRSKRRWILPLLLLLVVVGLLLVASLNASSSSWPATQAWAARREQALLAGRRFCPVLDGEPLAGHFGDSLLEAGRLVAAVPGAERRLVELVTRDVLFESADTDPALLSALAPALAALRRAAHQDGAVAGPWSLWRDARSEEVAKVMGAFRVLLLGVRERAESDPAAACRMVLDGLRASSMLANGDTVVDLLLAAGWFASLCDATTDEMLRQLGAADREHLAAGLAALDAAMPDGMDHLARWVVHLTQKLGGEGPLAPEYPWLPSRWSTWRFGFSVREWGRSEIEPVVTLVESASASTPAPDAPWSQASAWLQDLDRRAAALPLPAGGGHVSWQGERSRRGALVMLRQLRLAVAFHQRLDLPALRDPLGGGDLRVTVDGDSATFASAEPSLSVRIAHRRAQ